MATVTVELFHTSPDSLRGRAEIVALSRVPVQGESIVITDGDRRSHTVVQVQHNANVREGDTAARVWVS